MKRSHLLIKTGRLLLLFLLPLSLFAGLSFDSPKNYPAMGIMFPNFSRGLGDPIPLPEAHAYVPVNASDTLTREDRFSPYELWHQLQACGRWRDPDGRSMLIGRLTHRYPSQLEKHVSRERFSLEMARSASLIDPKKLDQLSEVVAAFTLTPVYSPVRKKIDKFALDQVLHFPTDAEDQLIYAFRPRRTGSSSAHDWFCVSFQFLKGENALQYQSKIEEDFLRQIKLPPRTSKDSGVTGEELDVEDPEKVTRFPYHPVRAEARKSIENYDNWWVAETEGYMILSDVYSETGKSLIRELQKELPAMRALCRSMLPPLAPLQNEVSLIRIFQRQEDYLRYFGPGMEWSCGAWVPQRRELVLFQKGGIEEMMPIIRHESFHQYLSYAYGMLQTSPWLNEGHACLFESAWMGSKKQMLISENEDRAYILTHNLDTATALLPLLFTMSYDTFYDGTQSERSLKYAMAWGVSYFLQKGVPVSVVPETYPKILSNYSSSFAKTHQELEATEDAFAGINMEEFQDAFRTFWLSERVSAEQYDPASKKRNSK